MVSIMKSILETNVQYDAIFIISLTRKVDLKCNHDSKLDISQY